MLNDLIQHLKSRGILGWQGIRTHTGCIHNFVGAGTAFHRIDLKTILEPFHGLLTVADFTEAPHHDPDTVSGRFQYKISVRHLALVSRRQEQILAALALVGSGGSEVGEVLEGCVVGIAVHAGRDLHHRGPVHLQVKGSKSIDRDVVAGQVVLAGLHEVGHHSKVG